MRTNIIYPFIFFLVFSASSCKNKEEEKNTEINPIPEVSFFKEAYRPQFHFTPEEMWMNDPNGLVYNNGIYHLFYQYYPEDIVWGPMHWGHATSKDLVFWDHKPIALFPDENGYIFSGSAVVDNNNTSGLGTQDNPPLVAIFTYHDINKEKDGSDDFQTQGIAYSLDNGDSWTKYQANPVLGNEGIRDFRDPKVFWYEPTQSWIMVLVAGDHAKFYRSDDLISWTFLSEFGKDVGAHGGVWECPDLFPLKVSGSGEEKWVLIISINPGAPNGGSGTQYFIGEFDGTAFTSNQTEEKWIDWGTDNYAGITYNNEPNNQRFFIGWMSNWAYARDTPTKEWRSAMTVPRSLSLIKSENIYELTNYPLDNFGTIFKSELKKDFKLADGDSKTIAFDHFNQSEIRFKTPNRNFEISFNNSLGEQLLLTLDGEKEQFLLDRSKSGKTGFKEEFGKNIQKLPLTNIPDGEIELRVLMDWSSIEIFINGGQRVMTAQIFPNENYTKLSFKNSSAEILTINDFELSRAESIW
jgi:fructan beta-fructosidase